MYAIHGSGYGGRQLDGLAFFLDDCRGGIDILCISVLGELRFLSRHRLVRLAALPDLLPTRSTFEGNPTPS